MSDKSQVKKCADLLQAIAEPNRIRIIECLWDGSKNVTELANLLDVKIVNVSHHLGVLRSAGLVRQEKKGRFVVYSLHPGRQHSNGKATPRSRLVPDGHSTPDHPDFPVVHRARRRGRRFFAFTCRCGPSPSFFDPIADNR
jgi:ArsR family transcriptional regulator